MLRVISEARPHWIVGENVAGIINMALDDVLSDLENEGYACQAFVIPACAINAPHRRDRVWIIAHNSRAGTRMEEHRCCRQGREFTDTLESAVLRQEDRAGGTERRDADLYECGRRRPQYQIRAVKRCANGAGQEVGRN